MIQISLTIIGYAIVIAIASMLGMYIWKRRTLPGSLYFSILMGAVSVWAFLCIGEALTAGTPAEQLLARLEYLMVTMAGPLWLLFVLDYGYRSQWPITKKTQLIWLIPVVVMVLALTNEGHGLIWPRGPGDVAILRHGAGLWVNLVYTYALLLAGFALLMWTAIRSYRTNRLKVATLLLGTLLPVVTSLLYMLGMDPETVSQITPLAISATLLLYAYSIFGQRLFDLVPVAREVLVHSMFDGVLVLDRDGLVADMNPAAMQMFGTTGAALGQPAASVLSRWPDLAESCRGGSDGPIELRIDGMDEPVWVDVRTSVLCDGGGRTYGRVIALRNVTNRKLAEEGLKRSNESLQAEINERKRAEAGLEASLKEKELLLKEIHHRVKNNLQIVSSLLSLQIGNASNEGESISLKESQNRIRSMALIHEKLYQSSDLAVIDFREYVESLVASLTRSYILNRSLKIDVDVEDVSLDIDTAIPCGLIINELISNCLKYAFPGGETGEIRVSLHRSGGLYRLIVSDNGVGLPPGLDFRDTASLGLQLVITLAGQLNGTIERPEGKGTTFVITFSENAADKRPLSGKNR